MALVSEAAYHLDELIPIAEQLSVIGIDASVYLLEATGGPLQRFRSAHRRYARSVDALAQRGLTASGTVTTHVVGKMDGLIVMNDWGRAGRGLVDAARSHGVHTFGKVEGAQDFLDVDTGKQRHAYRHVDTVFCQGQNDVEALDGQDCVVVGNSRIEEILGEAPPERADSLALINSNFSYGVLGNHRSSWLTATQRACDQAGVPFLVSQHPAERALLIRQRLAGRRTKVPIEQVLRKSSVLVTRFSSVCVEALALGIPVCYANPHGESLGVFEHAKDALSVASSTAELSRAIGAAASQTPESVRSAAQPFLDRQIDRQSTSSAQRTAQAVAEKLKL